MVAQLSITKHYKTGPEFDSRNYLLMPSTQQRVDCMDSSSPKPESAAIENNNAVYVEGPIVTSQVKIIRLVTRQDANILTALVNGRERTFDCSHTVNGSIPPGLESDFDGIYGLGPGDLVSLNYVRVSQDSPSKSFRWAVVLSWALLRR